jgi:O-antigen ligase
LADVRRFAWVQIVGVSLCALAILTHADVGSEGRLSAEVTYYDANDLATLIVCTLPLVLYLWRRPTRWPGRLALAAATVFLMMTLGETGSRGGFLGFVVVAGYLLLRFKGISGTKRVGAVAVLVVLLMALASDRYFARIETILHPSGDYNWSGKSATGRVEIWKRGVEYMLSHPVLGVGAANFPRAEGTLSPEAHERQRYGRSFRWSTAHNSFVQIGAELGVLGVVFLLGLLVDGFRAMSRIRRWPAGEAAVLAQVLTACLVGFVVTAMFLSQAYSAYLYSLLGMCLGLSRAVSAAAAGGPAPARPGVWGPTGAFPLAGGLISPSR